MSEHKTHQVMVEDKAVTTLRTLASVAVENAELARLLGMAGQGWIEDELARLWRALAVAVESGLDVTEVAARTERDSWTEKPSALTFWGNLSRRQLDGIACLICGDPIAVERDGKRSAAIDGKQMFVHRDADVCTRVLAEKLAKEVPF